MLADMADNSGARPAIQPRYRTFVKNDLARFAPHLADPDVAKSSRRRRQQPHPGATGVSHPLQAPVLLKSRSWLVPTVNSPTTARWCRLTGAPAPPLAYGIARQRHVVAPACNPRPGFRPHARHRLLGHEVSRSSQPSTRPGFENCRLHLQHRRPGDPHPQLRPIAGAVCKPMFPLEEA